MAAIAPEIGFWSIMSAIREASGLSSVASTVSSAVSTVIGVATSSQVLAGLAILAAAGLAYKYYYQQNNTAGKTSSAEQAAQKLDEEERNIGLNPARLNKVTPNNGAPTNSRSSTTISPDSDDTAQKAEERERKFSKKKLVSEQLDTDNSDDGTVFRPAASRTLLTIPPSRHPHRPVALHAAGNVSDDDSDDDSIDGKRSQIRHSSPELEALIGNSSPSSSPAGSFAPAGDDSNSERGTPSPPTHPFVD